MSGGRLLALALAALALFAVLAGSGGCQENESPRMFVDVFAQAPFYLARAEAEESFRGVLRRVAVREGPDTRDMPFELVAGEERLAVYVAGAKEEELLGPFVDREVEVTGKRVSLRDQGFGEEIWIARISFRQP